MKEFEELVGKKVLKLLGGKNGLVFVTDQGSFSYDPEGDCCSHSWFEHVSGIDNLVGHTVSEVDTIEMAEVTDPEELAKYDSLAQYGYRISTDKGYFEIEMRNDSNGYYGGFIVGGNPSAEGVPELTEDF